MEDNSRAKELAEDVSNIAQRMREALRKDFCAKLNAMSCEARQKLHERLVASPAHASARCAIDLLCAGGITEETLASNPQLAKVVDSGQVVEPMLEVSGGMRRSFLSLQTAWEHLQDWCDSADELVTSCCTEWQLLESLGALGQPIEVRRHGATGPSPYAIEVSRVCATPADSASFVAAFRAKSPIVPPEGGAIVEDLLILVDPDAPRASRLALSSKMIQQSYASLVHCRELHLRSGLSMNLALHAHALFTTVQPPGRGVRKEDLEAHMRRQYLGRAYQCAQCSFGPIDHFACGDLAFHNGQQVGSAVINNACPRCGWFARVLSTWPKWDGTVPLEALNQCVEADETFNITAADAEIALRICYSARACWDPKERREPRRLCRKLADWEPLTLADGVEHPVQLLLALAVADDLPDGIFGPVPMAQLLNEVCARRADDELSRVGAAVGRRRVGAFLGVSFFSAPQPSEDPDFERQRAAVLESCRADYTIDPDAFDFKSWTRGALAPWAHAILFARRLRAGLARRQGGWSELSRDMEVGPAAYADVIREMQKPMVNCRDSPAALLGVHRKEDALRVLATVVAQAFLHHSPQSRRTREAGGLLEEPLGDVLQHGTLRSLCVELRMFYFDEALAVKRRAREEMRRKLDNGTHVHGLSKEEFWDFWKLCYGEERRLFLSRANQGFVSRHG